MKYVYYMNKNNTGNKIVSLKELKNELNKVCVSTTYVNEWLSVESTDLKKVQKVLRAIRKGEHYIIVRMMVHYVVTQRKEVMNND